MKKRIVILVSLFLLASLCLGAGHGFQPAPRQSGGAAPNAPVKYRLTAWGELGMHCMDGKDYSIFSVLPPFNTIHAQLMTLADPPVPVTSGVTITYEAVADPTGSINTISSTKTNFWTYVQLLLHVNPPPDVGITGSPVQSRTPHPFIYNPTLGYWEVIGVPTAPYDDNMKPNAYPLAKIVARDLQGNILATAKVVVPVSDEMSCFICHASNSDPFAKPKNGWVNHPDPAKDVKLNILRKHDDRFDISGYLDDLSQMVYFYQSTLEKTANSGTPVLCAVCHASNALGTAGLPGIGALTADMHTLHGPQIYLKTGKTLDESNDLGSCYLCHPGINTKCKRGAMSPRHCADCHGNTSFVGGASRVGWSLFQSKNEPGDGPGRWWRKLLSGLDSEPI